MKYEIIRHISKIKEWNSVSIQFNEVKWYNGKPKYDLRKWEDGEPKKGITLEREDLETLYIALGRELGYEQHDKKETEEIPFINNSVEENVEELMDYRNFIVYGAYEDCMKKGHNCQGRYRRKASWMLLESHIGQYFPKSRSGCREKAFLYFPYFRL